MRELGNDLPSPLAHDAQYPGHVVVWFRSDHGVTSALTGPDSMIDDGERTSCSGSSASSKYRLADIPGLMVSLGYFRDHG
jgi:hypothetical protein